MKFTISHDIRGYHVRVTTKGNRLVSSEGFATREEAEKAGPLTVDKCNKIAAELGLKGAKLETDKARNSIRAKL